MGKRLGDVDISEHLGTGMVDEAVKRTKKRKKRVRRDLNSVMSQIKSGRRK